MPIAPITGRLKKGLVLDLTVAIGYHIPAVTRRDAFYVKLEQERAAAKEA
ncbi:hypothetical protein ABW19_dt0201075 [Dactylella cylindrospora]|nr:hypothetical protein ABW19_dt0201075 [Dactylella cylindrospora]